MRVNNYGENRTTERTRNQGSKPESKPRCLGTIPGVSTEHGTYKVRASGENSHESNTSILGSESIEKITGKLISQLVCEANKQLAYHEQQAALLRDRIEELEKISEVQDTE
jgi:hypothetical protein